MRRVASTAMLLSCVALVGCSSDNVTGPGSSTARWTRASAGLPGSGAGIALTTSGTVHVLGTDFEGVFRSTDDGVTWSPPSSPPGNSTILSLVSRGTLVVAGTGDGVFRSMDRGVTWTAAAVQPTQSYIMALASSGMSMLAGTGSGVFRSMDDGRTWRPTLTQPGELVVSDLEGRLVRLPIPPEAR